VRHAGTPGPTAAEHDERRSGATSSLPIGYLVAGLAIFAGLATWALTQQYRELTAPSAAVGEQATGQVFPAGPVVVGAITLEGSATLGFLLVAALIAWRRADDRMARFVALMLAAFGVALPGTCTALVTTQPIWSVAGGPLQMFGWLLLLPFACLFPDGRFVPHWSRFVLPVWAIWVVVFFTTAATLTQGRPAVLALTFFVWAGGLGAGVLAQAYRYRAVSTFAQRQQTKWVVLGFALAIPGLGIAVAPHVAALVLGHPLVSGTGFALAALALFCATALLLPGALAIAILRHHLYDVDLVINRTLVYGSLTASLAGIYAGLIVGLEAVAGLVGGADSQRPAVLVVSTLAIAALSQPLRRRLQTFIDRRFYRAKYDAARTLAAFGAVLSQDVELAELREHLLGVVVETLRPEHVSLWLRPPPPPPES
jgi:hypothetical protein